VKDSRNIVLDSDKAPLVKRLFEEYSTGKYSVSDMASKADSWGLKSVFGNNIAKSGMHTLLRRSAYYGLYQHSGEYHQGSYEPLITKKLFNKVQAVLENNGKPRKKDWKNHTYKGSLIRCGSCNCSVTATTKVKFYKGTGNTGVYSYYHCTRRRGVCRQLPIKDTELEEMIKDYLLKVEIDKEVWKLGVELCKAKYGDEIELGIKARKRIEKDYVKVERQIKKLLKMRLDEEISIEEYAEGKKLLLDEKISIKEKLEDTEHTSNNWLELAEDYFNNCLQVREVIDSDDYEAKRKMVEAIGWNLILKDKKLDFRFKKPYDVLLKPRIREDVQGRRESNFYEVVKSIVKKISYYYQTNCSRQVCA
jgi:hypothetical protein